MSKIPKLRFKEFSGEWKIEKFGELTEFQQGVQVDVELQSKEPKNGYIKFLRIENYTQNSQDSRYIPNDLAKNKTISENEIAVVRYGATAGFIGRGFNGVLANNLFKLVPNSSILDTEYLFQYLKSHKVFSFFQSEMSGGAMPALSFGIVQVLKIPYPSILEQQKIASFLSAIDTKIYQLTRKKELLEQYKKGVMQKIFSQELRFKADDGSKFSEWEDKKLGEIFHSEKGKGISKNKIVENGKYQCVLYGELYTKYNEVIFEVISRTNEEDGIKSQSGDLLIPSSTTTTGIDLANVTALNKDNVLIGGDITVLRSKEKTNNIFYAYYLSNHKKDEIASYAQGSTIVHLYYSHIKDMVIDLPSLEEQTKIANFLTAIDTKIDLATQQLEEVKQFKKGLLQQMFV